MNTEQRKEYLQADFLGDMKEIADGLGLPLKPVVEQFLAMWPERIVAKKHQEEVAIGYLATEFMEREMPEDIAALKAEDPEGAYLFLHDLAKEIVAQFWLSEYLKLKGILWRPRPVS